MRILYLGPVSPISEFLQVDNEVVITESPFPINISYDCIISYGYRHKIPNSAIDSVNGRAVNLHISYLPWNRGANPNYWSWHDDTPRGVTIHYVDEGFDTGDIIIQKEVIFGPQEYTLRSTYDRLKNEIETLFMDNWDRLFQLPRTVQPKDIGTVHTTKEKMLLPNGWDTFCDSIGKDAFPWDIVDFNNDISFGKEEERYK